MKLIGRTDGSSRYKPVGFADHLTLAEVANAVGRDKSRIVQLEKAGRIAAPVRVKVGKHKVRLYSKAELSAIVVHFQHAKTGRPKGGRL